MPDIVLRFPERSCSCGQHSALEGSLKEYELSTVLANTWLLCSGDCIMGGGLEASFMRKHCYSFA
jgi:hypothetical protein